MSLIQKIVDTLRPHFTKEDERQALIELALHDSKVLQHIKLEGSPLVFTTNLVNVLETFGADESGKPPIILVLETVKKQLGKAKQAEIDTLIAEILATVATDPVLPPKVISSDKPYIFISYARPDQRSAAQIEKILNNAGFQVFRDNKIESGDHWDKIIENALRDSEKMVLLLSKSSMPERKEVYREWFYFEQNNKPIIPIMLEDCERHSRMLPYNYIDARTNFDSALRVLLSALTKSHGSAIHSLAEQLNALSSEMLPLPEWVPVPAGKVMLGGQDLGLTEHTVDLDEYLIAKTPVTQRQYELFVSRKRHRIPHETWGDLANYSWDVNSHQPPADKLEHPVVLVNAYDADAYCDWLQNYLARYLPKGWRVLLPSEPEWERAARGASGKRYPWGKLSPSPEHAHFNAMATAPVGHYPESITDEGCLDMIGNVYEWTRSAFRPYPYDASDGRETPNADEERVLRGGCWRRDEPRDSLRPAYRHHDTADYLDSIYGFRPVIVKLNEVD